MSNNKKYMLLKVLKAPISLYHPSKRINWMHPVTHMQNLSTMANCILY